MYVRLGRYITQRITGSFIANNNYKIRISLGANV